MTPSAGTADLQDVRGLMTLVSLAALLPRYLPLAPIGAAGVRGLRVWSGCAPRWCSSANLPKISPKSAFQRSSSAEIRSLEMSKATVPQGFLIAHPI